MTAIRVYLDTNVFISAFETSGARSDHAWWLLRAVERGEIIGGTSELTLAELLVKPFESGAEALAEAYQAMLQTDGPFEVHAVDRDILIEAAQVRARRNAVKLPDAIHVASAYCRDFAFFVSGDRRLPAKDGLRQLRLGPFTLDDIRENAP